MLDRAAAIIGWCWAAVLSPGLWYGHYRGELWHALRLTVGVVAFAVLVAAQSTEVLAQRVARLEDDVKDNRALIRNLTDEVTKMRLSVVSELSAHNRELQGLRSDVQKAVAVASQSQPEGVTKEDILIWALFLLGGGGASLGGKKLYDRRNGG